MIRKVLNKCGDWCRRSVDAGKVYRIRRGKNSWPCSDKKYLLVGCESSGTSIISRLLFAGGNLRFLDEGIETWVWRAYMSIYQGESGVRDYPRLQLFDAVKVPGFAAILDKYVEEFPNTSIIYVVRDPRDVVVSAMKTWKASNRDELRKASWVEQTWLGIKSEDPIVRMASRWEMYLDISDKVPDVIYVRYEDFCADKVACVASLADRLELDVDVNAVRAQCDRQATHRSVRDYKPTGPGGYRSGILAEGDIRLIESVCGDHMRVWGYL